MERRTFVQVMVGAAAVCGIGGVAAAQKWSLMTDQQSATGPQLIPGLALQSTQEGADLYRDGDLVFKVNDAGERLISMADGITPLQTIMDHDELGSPQDIALFFISLGEAGYLQQQVQVNFVEAQV